jgi:hypothetical protein
MSMEKQSPTFHPKWYVPRQDLARRKSKNPCPSASVRGETAAQKQSVLVIFIRDDAKGSHMSNIQKSGFRGKYGLLKI